MPDDNTEPRFACGHSAEEVFNIMYSHVAEHGIFYVNGRHKGVYFVISIGLWSRWGVPDWVVAGVTVEQAMGSFWTAFKQYLMEGLQFEDGDKLDIIKDYEITVKDIPYDEELWKELFVHSEAFNAATCERMPGKYQQFVFPDKGHRWPWDAGYNLDPKAQIMLFPSIIR